MNSRDRSRSRSESGGDWDELDAVFDALPQPVIAFDTDGAARRANAAVRSALGVDPSGLDADGYERLFMGFNPRRRDGSPVLPNELPSRRALDGEVVRGEFLTFTNPEGRQLSFETSAFPLRRCGSLIGAMSVWNDLTYRVGFEQGLRDSEKRYRSLVDLSPDGILVYCDGRFVFANPAAARMLRAADPAEIVGRPVLDLVSPARRGIVAGKMRHTPTDGSSPTFEEQLICFDGTPLDVDTTATAIEYHGRPAIQVMIRDSSVQKMATRTLEQRVAERTKQLRKLAFQLTHAEQQERHRLARVLHDHVQQLLVAAKLHVGILRQNVPATFLAESARQAEDLLRQALDASRSLTVELSPPILHESGLAAGLEWLGRSMWEKHGLVVEVDADPGAQPEAMSTRAFLYESARELLFNVVKHANAGRARLTLARVDALAEVKVEDEGDGFDPGVSPERSARSGGFGLFSIQQRIEFLGGSVTIDSHPGKGCRIAIRLPIVDPERAPAPPAPAIGRSEFVPPGPAACDWRAGPRIRVLLADDHKIVRQGLIHLLQGEPDFDVVGEAGDGKVAIEAARITHPDVVVMDVSMPDMNGIEATRRILAEFPEIRVVGLSMHDEEDLALMMCEAGATAFVTKGGPSEDLMAAIRDSVPHIRRSPLPTRADA